MFYICLEGECIAFIKDDDKPEKIINVLGVGRSFGERGLIKNMPRMLSFKAGPSRIALVGISKRDF